MPRVDFKHIPQQNNMIVGGLYVCLMPLVTLVVESKLSYEIYFSESLCGIGFAFILICQDH
jgi:hypothetical protein